MPGERFVQVRLVKWKLAGLDLADASRVHVEAKHGETLLREAKGGRQSHEPQTDYGDAFF
jgi:hypothetical protein